MDSSVDISPEELKAMGDNSARGNAASGFSHLDYVNDLVSANKVVMFSKSRCPHCDDSKELLSNLGVNYTAVELDRLQDGKQLQNVLGNMTNARTVPRIFIDGKCVGGNSDLQTLHKRGDLKDMLKEM